jgi:hypothetical protein
MVWNSIFSTPKLVGGPLEVLQMLILQGVLPSAYLSP